MRALCARHSFVLSSSRPAFSGRFLLFSAFRPLCQFPSRAFLSSFLPFLFPPPPNLSRPFGRSRREGVRKKENSGTGPFRSVSERFGAFRDDGRGSGVDCRNMLASTNYEPFESAARFTNRRRFSASAAIRRPAFPPKLRAACRPRAG